MWSTVRSLLQGQPVWWTVTLQRPGFVSKIWIINRLGCWFAQMPKHVSLSNSVKTEEANCKVYSWKDTRKTLMICEPLISASNVTIYEDGVDDLSLCEVMITAIGEKCKRFLFHVHWFSNSNLLMKILDLPSTRFKTKKEKLLSNTSKFGTVTVLTRWHPCCASETRSWCWLWSAQEK